MARPGAPASPRSFSISCVWFFVLGGLGSFFPFYSLYLHANLGLSGGQVGMVLAVFPLIGLLAQPIWGHVADVSGSRGRVVGLLGVCAGCGYAALSLGSGFASMLLLTALVALFSTSLVPSTIAVTLAITKDGGARAFGYARVWGTVGFLISVVAFPSVMAALGGGGSAAPVGSGTAEPQLGWMFVVTGVVIGFGGLLAFALPRTPALSVRAPRGEWRGLISHGPYVRLLVFAFLAFFLLQGPMGLFPVYVRAHGGEVETVSQLWVPMLLMEIPLVALSGASLERFGARGLLAIGVLAGGVRWVICGFFPESPLVYPAQALHGVVVAGLIIGGPLYVEEAVPEELRSTGQNLLAMIGASLGGITSNLAAGGLLDRFGPDAPYQAAGVGSFLLGALVWFILPKPSRPGSPRQPS